MAHRGKAVKLGIQQFGPVAIFTAFVDNKLHAVVQSGPCESMNVDDESELLVHILETLAHRVLHLEANLEQCRAALSSEKESSIASGSESRASLAEMESMRADLNHKKMELDSLRVETQRVKKAHTEALAEIANLKQSIVAIRQERKAHEDEERQKLLRYIDRLKVKNKKLKRELS